MIGVAICAVYATAHDAPVFLDVAILMALVTLVQVMAITIQAIPLKMARCAHILLRRPRAVVRMANGPSR